ncbi:hypothetical protein CCUS01_13175 [Colletotrichum cuscutae]|uniref:AAA+ ATPase domain-containing protein n=1 Tax=Colletotrichum cuscutae TaxID=1209917 RepID=A0AAI9YCR9_9PEZI|nr:hypothetical protein CCUS01_13175 [Colletotrichum cuscutae]
MKVDDETVENGHLESNEGPGDGNEPANGDASTSTIDTNNHISANGVAPENQVQDQHLTVLPVVSVRHESGNNKQPATQDGETKGTKPYSCHTLLEIVVKSAGTPKQEEVKAEDTAGKERSDPRRTDTKPKPVEASNPKEQSKESIKKSRAAWRSMQFPNDIEKIFNDGKHKGSALDIFRGYDNYSRIDSSSRSNTYSDSDSHSKSVDDASSWAESAVSDVNPEDVDDDSPSRLEWLRQKREDNEKNPHLDQLMSLVGLENVKAHFLAVKARVKESKGTDPGLSKLRLHLVLHGKDGTGKKTIAKLYAQFLLSIGAVNSLVFSKKPTAMRRPYRPRHRKSSSEPYLHPTVVFYDKPNFSQASSGSGYYDSFDSDDSSSYSPWDNLHSYRTQSSDTMKDLAETALVSVVIISTRTKSLLDSIEGNEKALEELQSPLCLADYSDEELKQLAVRIIQKRGMSVEGGFEDRSLRALVQRVARERKSKSFSNIHRLEEEVDKACTRRALRLQKEYARWLSNDPTGSSQPADFPRRALEDGDDLNKCKFADSTNDQKKVLKSEDLLGTEPKDLRNDNESWKKLQDMIGLEKVKSECGDIIDYAQINYRRELQGMEPLKIGLNRVFLGPPGVGKTTVAQLYGQILIDLGLVSGKKIMLRNPSHLIGAYIGHSEKMTMGVLNEARGNVLIIDDAHMLYPGAQDAGHKTDVFRIAVLDTIVANVSAEPEDRCIILVGYDHEMGQLFNNSNPGLQRRFPKETALRFDTYSEDELCQIMDLSVEKSGLEMSKDAAAVSRQVLSRMRINPKFGNAGDVENLLNQAKVRINARITSASRESGSVDVVIEPGDIDPHWDRESQAGESRATLFEGFVGFNRIVEQFEGYQHLVAGMRLYDIDPRPHVPWSFIFKGPPGTGKTSTARKVGRLYYDMGLLSTDEVVACSVSDLVGKHVGETGPKVLNTLEIGLGKVLFIDEAYRLANDSKFHVEAVGELVDAMTQVRYMNNMVVILAGYTVEMDFLLQVNPGLRSRFPEQIVFQPMSPHACLRHLRQEAQKLKINIMGARGANNDNVETVYRLFKKLGLTRGWASGRDVETLAKTIIGNAYKRAGRTKKKPDMDSLQVTLEEVIKAQKRMLKERLGRMSDEAED